VEQNFEESILSLQYTDRLRALDIEYQKQLTLGPTPESLKAYEQMLEKLLDENRQVKLDLVELEQNEQAKFEEVKNKLGLDYAVQTLIKDKLKGRELKYVQQHQQAKDRCFTLQDMNSELREKLK